MEITREMFDSYNKAVEHEKIAVWATYAIAKLTGLDYEDIKEITTNYKKYEQQYK